MDYSLGSRLYEHKKMFENTMSQQVIEVKPVQIYCSVHANRQTGMYCVQSKCFQPLCFTCVQQHIVYHKKCNLSDLGVKQMTGLRQKCLKKINKIIDDLDKKVQKLDKPPTPQQLLQKISSQIQNARNEAHLIIEEQFQKLKQIFKSKISQSVSLLANMNDIHSKLQGIILGLKQIGSIIYDGGRIGPNAIPQYIKRAFTLDEIPLVQSFEKQAYNYDNIRKLAQFQIIFRQDIFRNNFRQSLSYNSKNQLSSNVSYVSNISRQNKYKNYTQQSLKSQTNLPLRAKNSHKIPYLHFFQIGSSNLHLISLEDQKNPTQEIINIQTMQIPQFHASILSKNCQFVYLSGGKLQSYEVSSKIPYFYTISLKSKKLKKQVIKVKPRSSHTLCQDANGDIYILGGYGPLQKQGDDPTIQNSLQRISQKTGKLQHLPNSQWGGSNISFYCQNKIIKACEQGVQIYNILQKQWSTALLSHINIQYPFFKSSCCACLNDQDVLVFGGFDYESSPSDSCHLWKIYENGKIQISKLNCRLPYAQGMEKLALVQENNIYALQNQQDQEQNWIDDKRRLIKFSLKQAEWKLLPIKQDN